MENKIVARLITWQRCPAVNTEQFQFVVLAKTTTGNGT